MEDEDRKRRVNVKRIKRVYNGFLKVDEAVVSFERYDGKQETVTRLSLERGDSVCVLLLDRKSTPPRIWLVEQFRYPTHEKGPGWIQELPAGVVERGEDPADAVRREVEEEAGLAVRDLEQVSTFYVSPGGTSERIFLYFGRVDGQNPETRDRYGRSEEGEDIRLIDCPAVKFVNEAKLGIIDDAKTLIAGLWLAAHWERAVGMNKR